MIAVQIMVRSASSLAPSLLSSPHKSHAGCASCDNHDHFVQLYQDDDFLVARVVEFASEALNSNARFLLIATPAHRDRIARELEANGIDVDDASASERYVELDAATLLTRFMKGDTPDAVRFAEEVGSYVTRFTASGSGLYAFGEMVGLLCERGAYEAAVQLEHLWCQLANESPFKLFCAYPLRVFANTAATRAFERVCEAHGRVIPAETCPVPVSLGQDLLRRIAALQQRSLALEAEVAERKRVEAALRTRESELRRREAELRAFVETAGQGLHWVDANGTIIWANAAELELLGYSSTEYIGRHIREFHADPHVLEDILARLKRGEKLRDYEARLRCKNGAIKTVVIDSSVLWENGRFVHTQCFTRDVTEQRRLDEAIRHWAAVVESSDDAIFSNDLKGTITSWNPAAQRMFGYTAAEAIGRPIAMLLPREQLPAEQQLIARLRAGERVRHFETVRRRKDGTQFDISITVSPIRDAEGRIIGSSRIAREVSERARG
jgi:PAS domain S-box-containing protein